MPNPTLQRIRNSLSLRHIRGVTGHSGPNTIALHSALLARDYIAFREEFLQSTIDATMWTAANNGVGAASFAYSAQRGGGAQGTTGGGNPGSTVIYGNALYQSDDNPVLIVRFKAPAAVTNLTFEIGWVNVLTTKTTQGWNVDTPAGANGVTNGVALALDTGKTLTTAGLVGVGTSIAAAITTPPVAYTPTVSKWIDVKVSAGVGVGNCEVTDDNSFKFDIAVASGPDTGILMFPYIQFRDLGTSKVVQLDYIEIRTERNQT